MRSKKRLSGRNASLTRDVASSRVLELLEHRRPGGGWRTCRWAAAARAAGSTVAVAAPVSMFVAPGPIDAVQASVGSRRPPWRSPARRAPSPARSWAGRAAARRPPARSPGRGRARCRGRRCRRSPGPRGARSPSRSEYCACSQRTSAWPVVSRTVVARGHRARPAAVEHEARAGHQRRGRRRGEDDRGPRPRRRVPKRPSGICASSAGADLGVVELSGASWRCSTNVGAIDTTRMPSRRELDAPAPSSAPRPRAWSRSTRCAARRRRGPSATR